MSATEHRIAHLVARACAVDPRLLRRDRGLLAYGLDSLRAAELLGDLEAAFNLAIPDEDLVHMQTVEQMAHYIDGRLQTAAAVEAP